MKILTNSQSKPLMNQQEKVFDFPVQKINLSLELAANRSSSLSDAFCANWYIVPKF